MHSFCTRMEDVQDPSAKGRLILGHWGGVMVSHLFYARESSEGCNSHNPYPSTCWMVQRLTSRRLASSRWLTPLDRSSLTYSRCCPVRT